MVYYADSTQVTCCEDKGKICQRDTKRNQMLDTLDGKKQLETELLKAINIYLDDIDGAGEIQGVTLSSFKF